MTAPILREYIEIVSESLIYRGDYFGEEIKIYRDPSRREFLTALRAHGKLRGMLDRDLVIWDAYVATHHDMLMFLQKIGQPYDGSDLELEDGYVVLNSVPDDFTGRQLRQIYNWVCKHPILHRIYNGRFKVVLRTDSGQDIDYE